MLQTLTRGRARRHVAALALALALFVSACGGGGGGTEPGAAPATPTTDDFPVTVRASNGKVTIESQPERIVSLSPTATEMLFAIEAGDQVVAVDEFSNYPIEAPTTKLSGYEPNIEAIAGYEPDLVVVSDPGQVTKALATLGIPALALPAVADLEGAYEQIEQLGDVTGHADEAEEVVATMRTDIDEIVSSVPDFEKAPTYYHELDDGYFTVTSKTFVGEVYSLLGLENIADKAPNAVSGYPQLSVEYIVDADPDLIFLADTKCCDQSAASVAKRAGWGGITAVENEAIVELDDDVASRWGPRVVDFLRTVAQEVAELEGDA